MSILCQGLFPRCGVGWEEVLPLCCTAVVTGSLSLLLSWLLRKEQSLVMSSGVGKLEREGFLLDVADVTPELLQAVKTVAYVTLAGLFWVRCGRWF